MERGDGERCWAPRSKWPRATWRTSSRVASGGRAEAPQAPAPGVPHVVRALPVTQPVPPVAAVAPGALGVGHEAQGLAGEVAHLRAGARLTAGHDQEPGHVIGAIAMFGPWGRAVGVLVGPVAVRHPLYVLKTRGGGHAVTAWASATRPSARAAYRRATAVQAKPGARRAASRAMEAHAAGSVRMWRNAAPRAVASR